MCAIKKSKQRRRFKNRAMRKISLFFSLTMFFPRYVFADSPDFVPGRPGNTESPISVPEGHWQVETEVASYTHDETDGATTNMWNAMATSLRYGIAHGADLEVSVQP